MTNNSSVPTYFTSFILTTSINSLSYCAQMLVSGLISGLYPIQT